MKREKREFTGNTLPKWYEKARSQQDERKRGIEMIEKTLLLIDKIKVMEAQRDLAELITEFHLQTVNRFNKYRTRSAIYRLFHRP